jgi:uncharacterized protein YodC (DUF2158 family)
MQLQVGDVVQLKSGGPWMTVITRFVSGVVNCTWHGVNGKFANANFYPDMLSLIPKEKHY